MTSELVPYWDTIHSMAADTVQRIDGLTGYDLTNFYQVDSFTDDVFQYDVYYWSAAYKTDDPYALNWAGQMGLDDQGRVIGLNEHENTFVVRSDGATIVTGFEMPFDYDDISLARNREQVRLAFSQGINHP